MTTPQNNGDDGDIWGSTAPGAEGKPVKTDSAFDDPVVLEHQQEAEEFANSAQATAEHPTSAGKKPNLAILAGAGVLTLVVLGGLGFFGYKKYVARTSLNLTQQGSAPPIVTRPVEMASAAVAVASATDIFGANGVSVPASAAIPNAAVVAAPMASVASAVQVASSTPTSSPPPVQPKPPIVAAISPAAPASQVMAACACDDKKSSPVAGKVQATKPVTAQHKTGPKKTAVAKSKVQAEPVSGVTVDRAAESILLVKQMRVVGVFPLSGKNAQAWVQDSKGRMMVVRKDETIEGVRVVEVIAEKGIVRTLGGNISTTGLTEISK